MSLFEELKRRNVFKVGIAYVVASWLILQVADILLDAFGIPEWAIQLVIILLVVGFAVALIVAWAFELTPEGIKREREVDRTQSITQVTGRKLDFVIIGMLVLAVGYLLIDKFSTAETDQTAGGSVVESQQADPTDEFTEPEIDHLSIAVLPFDNRSAREEDQFFTDGIHDDLLTTLARIGSMKVISRTSVMEYRGSTKKIPDIADELGVAHVMEGAVQRSGETVRINVQLIDANTDEHLWADIYDRELTAENLFAIQSEISTAIAEALQATLSPEEEERINALPTQNLQAYDAYLRGRQLTATRRAVELERAIDEFRQAVTLDPEFALAWVGLADSLYLWTNNTGRAQADTIEEQELAVRRALELDPDLGEAYVSLTHIHQFYDRFSDAETAFQRAIELSPNYARAYQWYAFQLNNLPSRAAEAVALAQKAAELDPRSLIILTNLADAYSAQGLFSLAEAQYQKVLELDPTFTAAYNNLMIHYWTSVGRMDLALATATELGRLEAMTPSRYFMSGMMYLDMGDPDSAMKVREQLTDLDPNGRLGVSLDVRLNQYAGNSAGMREAMNWLLARPDQLGRFAFGRMALQELTFGKVERAREIYLTRVPEWLDPSEWDQLLETDALDACLVAWTLGQTGDEDLGAELLERALAYHETLPGIMEHPDFWNPDVCYLAAGDTERALESIEIQIDHNHLIGMYVLHQTPLYEPLRHEPRYQAAMADYERRRAEQRANVERMREEGVL